jgi:predicted nucleic acid-binding protein
VPEIISNTSPLLYLYRIGILDWLPRLFSKIWTSTAVSQELREGRRKGHDVPDLQSLSWLEITEPRTIPSEWLALDLGAGELSVLALALENPDRFVLLDDGLAPRRDPRRDLAPLASRASPVIEYAITFARWAAEPRPAGCHLKELGFGS